MFTVVIGGVERGRTLLLHPSYFPRPVDTKQSNEETSSHSTDLECLKTYTSLTSWNDFNNALPGILQERLVEGAMRASGGFLPCFKCHRNIESPTELIVHLKRCRKRVTLADILVPEPDETPAKKNKTVRPKSLNLSMSISSLDELKNEPALWLQLSHDEKLNLLKVLFPLKDIECFAIRTGSKKCPIFNDYKKAAAHLDTCIQPMYLTYVGERASEFRQLDKKTRARYVRDGMAMCMQLPCVECGRLFTHHYGLLYHVERCNVAEDEMPWKCYRCSFQTTRANSNQHLKDCWTSQREQERKEADKNHSSAEISESPVIGGLSDVTLRGGKAIVKETGETIEIDGVQKLLTEINAEDAIKSLLGPNRTLVTPKRRRNVGGNRACIAAGVLPENSPRLTTSGDGKMRFKFRKADKKGLAGMTAYPRYLDQVKRSHTMWEEEVSALPYCARLSDINCKVWEATSDFSQLPMANKESVGLRIHEERDQDHADIPVTCRRMKALSTTELRNEKNETVTVAYCGGPINAIRIAPNTMPSGDEVVAVVTYPCETNLVGRDMRHGEGLVQFWLLQHTSERSTKLVPWFILKSNYGLVFDFCWLDRPRSSPSDSLIGYFALGTAQGSVLIYRFDTVTAPSKSTRSKGVPVLFPEPDVILQQPKTVFLSKPDSENSEMSFPPPIHNLAWGAKGSGQYVVGVNAAGGAVIWDIQRSVDTPTTLLDSTWSSPVVYAAFIDAYSVALSFRERMIRVYDVRSYECQLEENAVRTAGSRVAAQPRLLPGFFSFQSEYFSSGEIPTTGVSFLCSGTGGYFVVPLANRHHLMTWDVSISSVNAVVASCGVDGRLLLSANGRLATFASAVDHPFCFVKAALTLTRRRCSEPETVNIATLFSKCDEPEEMSKDKEAPERRACLCYATHEETLEHLWLDVSLSPDSQSNRRRLENSSLDLRIESLNCVATNHNEKAFVLTGGQAGLLFVRPCVIDTELSTINEMFASVDSASKKSKQSGKGAV
ncbi:hypothetical protein Q1695_008715 [Nippostrongylus brasiliensis]|nr:hypothetical protein Q1695_008715 [Nippostrongylus brasiliensis]